MRLQIGFPVRTVNGDDVKLEIGKYLKLNKVSGKSHAIYGRDESEP